jgi:type IV secretion system protein VirB5
MKTKIVVIAMLVCGNSSAFATGIPVVDAAHVAETVAGWAAQATSMGKELSQLKQQYEQMQQQYQSLNGVRGLGDLVNNPELRKYLPSDYQSILNQGYGNASSIRSAAKIIGIDETSLGANTDAAQAFNSNAQQAALNRATAEEGYRQASARFDDIQVLLDKINDSPDAKDIADLQARIQAEQVMQQNESNRLAMLAQLAQAQKDLAEQRATEIGIKAVEGEIPRF